jgi:RecA/RadA recombinase
MSKVRKPIKRKKVKRKSKIAEEFAKVAERKEPKRKKVDVKSLVPTGSTTFNLECSGKIEGAFKLGTFVNIIGDSHAGKTLFALTVLAECAKDNRFKDYRLMLDDVEVANAFDIGYIFGEKLLKRLESLPEERSKTIEDFNDTLARLHSEGKPFILLLDSFDALTSEAGMEKDKANRLAREKGNQTKGSYGDGKAKIASEMFSKRTQEVSDSKSLVIVISQTRDNIGFGAMFTPKTRSGGRALKFYSFHEIWLAMQQKEKTGKRTIVTNVQAKITKNKLTGRHGESYFPILFDYGVDNLTSCINFLIDEGGWTRKSKKSPINTKGFIKEPMKIDNLIGVIEDNNREKELFNLCQETYDAIMLKLKPNRKRRY